jgi:hypothetical protein
VGTNDPDTLAALPRQNSRLYEWFTWLLFGSVILAIIMLFIWAYTFAFTIGVVNQTVNPWAPVIEVEWVALCGLLAVVGLCIVGVYGLLPLARPAWFAHLIGRDIMMRRAHLRRWPRLSGLAAAWLGLGIVGLALSALVRGLELVASWSLLVILLMVIAVPFWLVRIAASLVPHHAH